MVYQFIKKSYWLIIIGVLVFSSCEKEDPSIINISTKTPPSKVDYYINELMDLSGIIINLEKDDQSIEKVSFVDFSKKGLTTYPKNGSKITPESKEVVITENTSGKSVLVDINLFTLTDIDNNIYRLVKIGEQVWMAENLRTTRYNDDTDIPLVTNSAEWDNLSTPGYCWYNNDENKYRDTYGVLYNWYVVQTEKLAPKGWHIPSNSEWTELINYLSINGFSGNEGSALKAKQGWEDDGNGTDDFWFGAQPSGYRIPNGSSEGYNDSAGKSGHWWSSTEHFSLTDAHYLSMYDFSQEAINYHLYKKNGISIRCVKD